MTSTDWIIDLALILIVLRQLREARMDRRFFLLPLAIVGYTASHYLSTVPTAGNDLVLLIGCLLVGTALGVAGGLLTRVRGAGGQAFARASFGAAALWVVSMTARLGFIVYITHSAGSAALTRFSIAHQITGADVWQTALVLLALSEVVVRLAVIAFRGFTAAQSESSASAAADRVLVSA